MAYNESAPYAISAINNNSITTLVSALHGQFGGFWVNDALAKTITIYDGNDTTGRLIVSADAPAKGQFIIPGGGAAFEKGLTISCVSASSLSLFYKTRSDIT